MNSSLRYGLIALGFIAAWAVGYLFGGRPAGSARGSASATPVPATVASDGKLSSTAIGRMIDGKSDFQRTRTIYDYSLSLSAEAMAGAVNEAMQLPMSHRNMALSVLFARWAELDPEAAVKYAQLLPRSANAGFLRRTALNAWAERDFDAALKWAQSLEKGEARNECLSAVAGQLAKTDPNGALKLITENFTGRDAANAYENVFSAWAENDFANAYAAAQGITDPGTRVRAMRAALNQRVESDPRMVLDAIRTAKLSELRWDIGNRAMQRWMERDLTAARDYVLGLPMGEMRDQGMQNVAREMARRDPREGLAWATDLPDNASRDEAIQSLFSTWTGSDAKAALEAARGLPEGRLRDNALAQMAQNLVDTDLSTALALLKELPAGTSESAFQQVAWRWARNDPKGAAEWFAANVSDNNRWSLNQIVGDWARNDAEEALKWASNLADSHEQKGNLVGQVLGHLARNDVTQAAEHFGKLSADQQTKAVGNLVSNWVSRDPNAAAKWALALPDENVRNNAVSSVAIGWAYRDPAGTARWLDTIPAGGTRDTAVMTFATNSAQKDPEGAMAWALTIGDAGKREGAMMSVVGGWARKDRDAATQWVQTTNAIDAQTKARLEPVLKQSGNMRGPPQSTFFNRVFR